MSVRVLYDPFQRKSVMFCSTDGCAFGPLFDREDAIDFLEWMVERGRDPRDMNANTLDIWVKTWENEVQGREREPSDTEIYGAGSA